MISNELLEEVIYVSIKRQFISKGLLVRITIHLIEQLNYISKSKFNDIKFVNTKCDFATASWCEGTGIIELDYDRLIYEEKQKVFSYLLVNLSIIQALLHEVAHIDEIYKRKKGDIESKLINICSDDCLINSIAQIVETKYTDINQIITKTLEIYKKFTQKNYFTIPIEKIAEADSYKNLLKSLDNYPNFYSIHPSIYENILKKYISSLKMGYRYIEDKGKYNIPIFNYICALQKINSKIKLEDINFILKTMRETQSILSIEQRLKYGFNVTKEQIENFEAQKILKY